MPVDIKGLAELRYAQAYSNEEKMKIPSREETDQNIM